jgi:hypothetical protein
MNPCNGKWQLPGYYKEPGAAAPVGSAQNCQYQRLVLVGWKVRKAAELQALRF